MDEPTLPAAAPGRSLRATLDAGLGRGFWTLFSASFLANLADGIFQIALPLLAASLTRDPGLVAGVTFASRLPWLVFALIAGALADRFDRRRTMVLVDAGRVLVLGGLTIAVLANVATIWVLYLAAFVLGCFETMFDTAASSMLPNIVGTDRIVAANSRLNAIELTMNSFVGPPIGGFLVAVGVATAFGSAAAGYLGALLCLLTLAGSFRPVRLGPPSSIRSDIGAGLRYLFGHRLLRTFAFVVGPMNLASTAVFSVIVLYVVAPGPLGLDSVGFGLLITSIAVGTVVGTILAGRYERVLGRANLFVACILSLLVSDVVWLIVPQPVLIGLILALSSTVGGAFNVVFGSIRQRIVPNHLLGRVMASFRVISWGSLPLGALLGGVLGQAFGLPAVFIGAAAIHGVLLLSRLVLTDAFMDQVEAHAAANAGS
ncbi:MAG TPA: MFS transporter [Candidatus Limnocylindrales bacterium]|nr:MFS transporter [Candidatus Limnocylindrales bacterium]